jgi:hypothetical protein
MFALSCVLAAPAAVDALKGRNLQPMQEQGLDGSWLERQLAAYAALECATPPLPMVAFSLHGRGLAYVNNTVELTLAPSCPGARILFVEDAGCHTNCASAPVAGPTRLDNALKGRFLFPQKGMFRACIRAPACPKLKCPWRLSNATVLVPECPPPAGQESTAPPGPEPCPAPPAPPPPPPRPATPCGEKPCPAPTPEPTPTPEPSKPEPPCGSVSIGDAQAAMGSPNLIRRLHEARHRSDAGANSSAPCGEKA